MKANSLDLNIDVDLNSSNVIHNGEEPKMKRKNTIPYEGLLRSYTKDVQTSYPLPYGHKASISGTISGTTSGTTLTIDDQPYTLSSKTIKKVKDLNRITDDILSSSIIDEDVYRSTEDKLYKNNDIIYSGTNAVCDKGYTEGTILYYSGNTYTLSFAPNYIEINSTYLVYGYSVNDQYQCKWAARLLSDLTTDSASGSYLGMVGKSNDTIYVTGEPYYLNLTPTRLNNGVLRWTFDSTDKSTALTNNVSYSNSLKSGTPTTSEALYNSDSSYSSTGRSVSYGNASIRYAVVVTTSIAYKDYTLGDGSFLTMDPNASPGVFWTNSVSDYQNIFPFMYLFTNYIQQKGSTYDYGKCWSSFYIVPGIYSASESAAANGHTITIAAVEYSKEAQLRQFIDGTDSIAYLDVRGTSYITSTNGPIVDNNDNLIIMSYGTGTLANGYRPFAASDTVRDNKAWPSMYHSFGGTNSGDQGLVSSFPFSTSNGLYKVQYYSNIPISVSYDGVLISTANADGMKDYAFSGDYVFVDDSLYHIEEDTPTLYKIANGVYTTNSLTNDNLIVVSEDNVEVKPAYIDYNMSFSFSNDWLSLGLWMPSTSTNDVWMQSSGYNPNLKDDTPSTSYLFPAIEIPIYVNTGSLDEFNKYTIDGNAPLLTVSNDKSYPIDVYYTHTLKSTDITYKYTVKNSALSYEKDMEDNSWTATSSLTIYPLGIATVLYNERGINTASPSVNLKNNYAVALYSSNNSTFASFNLMSSVYKGTEVFTIYTSSYYFDGTSIYYVGGINEATSNSFVCLAVGMKYIASSGTEAYFWSSSDKSIYTFSGSTTLTKWKEMTNVSEIRDACFFPAEQSLYLLTDIGLIIISQTTAALFSIDGSSFNMTDEAVYFTSDDNKYVAYSPYKFDRIPLEIETEWIGDPTKLFNFGYMEYNLYKVNDKAVNIHIEADTLYDQNVDRTKRDITIKKDDWKSDMYRLRVSPANPVGNAVKYILTTDNDVAIQNMTFALDDASDNMAVRR